MPFITAPNLIEEGDFTAGWLPDIDSAAVPVGHITPVGTSYPAGLVDVLNLLPPVGQPPQNAPGGQSYLTSRPGFARLHAQLTGDTGRFVRNVFHCEAGFQVPHFLVIVTCKNAVAANNVKIYAYDLDNDNVQRIDTAGVTWTTPTRPHWGVSIDKVWYGGSKGNQMYSWDPSTWVAGVTSGTWNADASTGTYKTVVDATNAGVNTATQYGRDYAFKGTETVGYSGKFYQPNKNIRYDTWNDGDHYSVGDTVSYQTAWGQAGAPKYWKSFKCVKGHNAVLNTNDPLADAAHTFWQKHRLSLPQDASGDTADAWNFVPQAPATSIAAWHVDRLFLRFDGQGDNSRVIYSPPIKPEHHKDIPDTTWLATDWAPGSTVKGDGGGWLPFNDGKMHGDVEALYPYGQYLLVFKRRVLWALSGTDESTFTTRVIAQGMGTMAPHAVTEQDGVVYFLSDDGLYMTDGTSAQTVPGNDNVRAYITARMDAIMKLARHDGSDPDINPEVHAFQGFIYISLPCSTDAEPYVTLVYHPGTQSFWKLDLPILAAAVYRDRGVAKFSFGQPLARGTDLMLQYDNGLLTDDTGAAVSATQAINWRMQTGFWPFGTHHEERRIRRTWAVVSGAVTFALSTYSDWDDDTTTSTTTKVGSGDTQHVEGVWIPDCHSIGFKLSSSGTTRARIFGFAVATEPRRVRYHVNNT